MGTYTLNKRGGWIKKIYRVILTVRPINNGWINNIGLQNPGIKSIKKFYSNKIYSIASIEIEDWYELIEYIPKEAKLELNLSCPNVHQKTVITDDQIKSYISKYNFIIFKLSPTNEIYTEIDKLVNLGAKYIHIANTLPVEKGGESGERLKFFSLKTIINVRKKYPNLKIIGGGGIYLKEDIESYKKAGANHFSIASVWFSPLRAIRLLKQV